MTPADLRALRLRLRLSERQFGEALGLSDAARTVRRWEDDETHPDGRPYAPTGTALAAIRYVTTIIECLDPDLPPADLVARLKASLPKELRERT